MKLFRFGEKGNEKPGVLLPNGEKIDASNFGEDYCEGFFDRNGLDRLKGWLDKYANTAPRVHERQRIGTPICRPSKIICIGLNYRGHAKETEADIPKEPVVFSKATSAFSGPFDPVVLPRHSEKTDWEVELAFVIGQTARYVPVAEAMEYIMGYGVMNDYSEREFQIQRGGQWVKGKSCDTFAPFGPYLVTRDEIPDVGNLRLWLKVNGEMRQDSNTNDLIFGVPHLLSYLSHFMTLLPGDIVSTGTPAGVGLGMDPPVFLKPGDVVEYGIDSLGQARQEIVALSQAS